MLVRFGYVIDNVDAPKSGVMYNWRILNQVQFLAYISELLPIVKLRRDDGRVVFDTRLHTVYSILIQKTTGRQFASNVTYFNQAAIDDVEHWSIIVIDPKKINNVRASDHTLLSILRKVSDTEVTHLLALASLLTANKGKKYEEWRMFGHFDIDVKSENIDTLSLGIYAKLLG